MVAVSDFQGFKMELSSRVPDVKVTFQIGRGGECRVLSESIAAHNNLIKYFTDKKYKFYTFDTKTARPFKVVLKGLTNDQTVDEIKTTLTELLGFTPTQVIQMKRKFKANHGVEDKNNSKEGISSELYLIHFNRNEVNNLKILEKAHVLFHVRVKWELYRKYNGKIAHITQCRSCQKYGHGTKNCRMNSKCMVCGSFSHTKDNCPIKTPTEFKCANCAGTHKANYFQCPVRVAILQNRTGRKTSNNQASKRTSESFIPTIGSTSSVQARLSYATVVAGSSSQKTVNAGTSEISVNPSTSASTSVNNIYSNADLGAITEEKFLFLQQAMSNLMTAMLQANSMSEAIQIGTKYTYDIVLKLKFSNEFK